mmetsp:Transcript_6150/g.12510  ORF Transcript_6150/g.12510 Transcript_6150/m.12510 type:complete len:94 (-) Transcript_6150:820-1101(-)
MRFHKRSKCWLKNNVIIPKKQLDSTLSCSYINRNLLLQTLYIHQFIHPLIHQSIQFHYNNDSTILLQQNKFSHEMFNNSQLLHLVPSLLLDQR